MKGIITLEDVIEKLIQAGRWARTINCSNPIVACLAKENIEDESDRVERTATMRSPGPKRFFWDLLGRYRWRRFHEVSDLP